MKNPSRGGEMMEDASIQKVTLKANLEGFDEQMKKAEKYVELMKEAKSLAEELASLEFRWTFTK